MILNFFLEWFFPESFGSQRLIFKFKTICFIIVFKLFYNWEDLTFTIMEILRNFLVERWYLKTGFVLEGLENFEVFFSKIFGIVAHEIFEKFCLRDWKPNR